jgi:hypothetical protein
MIYNSNIAEAPLTQESCQPDQTICLAENRYGSGKLRVVKKFVGLLTIFSLTLAIPFHATAAEDKESFFPASLQQTEPQRVFSLGDDAELGFSQLGKWPDKLCTSTADPNCDFNDAKWGVKTIMASATLGVCTSQENEDCIESVEIARDGKEFSALKFEKYVTAGTCDSSGFTGCAFPPDPSKKLPRGGKLSIWSEVVDGKTLPIKYLVTYSYEMNYDDENKYFVINNVGLAIRPMKEIDTSRWDSLWSENGKSGIQFDFQSNVEMKATIHLSNSVVGWFKARMQNVDLQISEFSSRNNRLTVSAKAVTIPTFAVKKPVNELTSQEADFAQYFGYGKGVSGGEPGNPRIFEYLEYWRPKLQDIATHTKTNWSLKSTRWTSENKCLNATNRVLGVVSTNSMGYDGNPPKFVDGFLNYRVSGFHLGADGKTPNLGTYDLVLRSDAARCLYGFSSAPVSATVTIAGANGNENLATTVVAEKNGWLKMKAAGFTFSEKNIKVKLTQEAVPATSSSAGATSTSTTAQSAKPKLKTVNCFKGKITKKVTAAKPVCPTGYKKK